MFAAQGCAAECFGEEDEVGDASGVGGEVGVRIAALAVDVLELADHAEGALVDDGDLIGTPSMAAVASSWLVIWKQPSPSIAQTSRSGAPSLAPMAAGTA